MTTRTADLRLAWIALVAAMLFCPDARGQVNQLSDAEQKAGWKLLFDGRSLEGWRNYRQQGPGNNWRVVEGAITRVGGGGGDLITREQYDNFELALQFRISRGGNSGLVFRATEEGGEPWHTGPEIQIIDDRMVPQGERTGWLYALYPGRSEVVRPAGQWNELRLVVKPSGCTTFINGVAVNRFRIGNDDWNRRVAGSKFAEFSNFAQAEKGHICLQDHGSWVAFRDIKIREFTDGDTVFNPIDDSLPLKPVLAFPDLEWAEWDPISEEGRAQPLRLVEITNAGDGSNRLFVCTQRGVIYVFENRPDVRESKVFLDIRDQTHYLDREFERGLLGLAFHPNFKQNGEFFISYTTAERNSFDSVISRFRVDPNNPDRALPESEREVLRLKQPFWNHNGGTIIFGPDGYLYFTLGDGGAAGDPYDNAQNLGNLYGKIMRINVNNVRRGASYSIPADNPFLQRSNARSEIWAYGLRNVWRMSFDPQTGELWAADVGQDLFEEINLIRRGGNYGWNRREGMHSFGQHGTVRNDRFEEPIWEYDHNVGVSITGGSVYRGERLPALQGCYVYADFISGKLWALKYDSQSERVVANYEIPGPSLPVTSFGTDEQGEIFFTIVDANGRAVYRFEPTE